MFLPAGGRQKFEIDRRLHHVHFIAVQAGGQFLPSKVTPKWPGVFLTPRNYRQLVRIESHELAERRVDRERVVAEHQPISFARQRLQRTIPFTADQSIDDAEVVSLWL